MMLAIDNTAQVAVRRSWQTALAEYQRLRAISDAIPLGTEGEDEALDAYCVAMDHLIGNVRAPNIAAVLVKLDLIAERDTGPMPDVWFAAIKADLLDIDARGNF
jgi:hypothetical protein